MAAFRKADPDNLQRLVAAFPQLYAEFRARLCSVGGYLDDEKELAAMELSDHAIE